MKYKKESDPWTTLTDGIWPLFFILIFVLCVYLYNKGGWFLNL